MVAAEDGQEDVAAVIAELENEMQEASGLLEFERAAVLRDQIEALRSGSYRRLGRKPAASAKPASQGGPSPEVPGGRGGYRRRR